MKENSTELKILEVAEKEFLQKGYAGARTMQIAELAGVSHTMLHYYYRTKEDLFNKVFEEKFHMMTSSLIEAFNQPHVSLLDRIKSGMEQHFDFLAQNPDIPRFIINEMSSNPKYKDTHAEMMRSVGSAIAGMQDEINELADKGAIEKINISDLILDIVSMNVFVFIIIPGIQKFIINPLVPQEEFLARRKKENVEVIMRRLKKM